MIDDRSSMAAGEQKGDEGWRSDWGVTLHCIAASADAAP
jgi:hypothetical protein